ncbi:MAG: hypothetical protein ABJ381_11750 [Ilumatobacter sp.]|uniref:hypothetical protein n=1 Tax=Ilumatobacter sp. TaxID=1967498 RepID=UPI0032975A33
MTVDVANAASTRFDDVCWQKHPVTHAVARSVEQDERRKFEVPRAEDRHLPLPRPNRVGDDSALDLHRGAIVKHDISRLLRVGQQRTAERAGAQPFCVVASRRVPRANDVASLEFIEDRRVPGQKIADRHAFEIVIHQVR